MACLVLWGPLDRMIEGRIGRNKRAVEAGRWLRAGGIDGAAVVPARKWSH